MKKFVSFVLVALLLTVLSACSGETERVGIELDTPTAVFLDRVIQDNTATFNINTNHSDTALVFLVKDENVIEMQTVDEGFSESVTFSSLERDTIYTVYIESQDGDMLAETVFETGYWELEMATSEIFETIVDENQITVNFGITDVDQVVSNARVVVSRGVNIIQQVIVDTTDTEIVIDGLDSSKVYTIEILLDYNLGSGLNKNYLSSEVDIETATPSDAPSFVSIVSDTVSADSSETVDVTVTLDNPSEFEIKVLVVEGQRITNFSVDSTNSIITFSTRARHKIDLELIEYFDGFANIVVYNKEIAPASININFTEVDGYKMIHNAIELEAIEQDLDGSYKLANDIEFGNTNLYVPIGSSIEMPFTGVLDGQDYTIHNLRFRENLLILGLFETIEDALIKNINVTIGEYDLTTYGGTVYYGSIAGKAKNSTVENINIDGSTTIHTYRLTLLGTHSFVGGIIGLQEGGIVSDSTANGINYIYAGSFNNGGITGKVIDGDIMNCTVNGEMKIHFNTSSTYIGGIAGSIQVDEGSASITNSNVEITDIHVRNIGFIGGVAATVGSGVQISNSTVKLHGISLNYGTSRIYLGGVAALSSGTITDSVTSLKGEDMAGYYNSFIGGIVARNTSDVKKPELVATVTNAYSEIDFVNASGSMTLGGIVCLNKDGIIQNTKAKVSITGGFSYLVIGGVVGENVGGRAVISESEGILTKVNGASYLATVIGGVASINEIGSTIEDSIGSILESEIIIYPYVIDYYPQQLIYGGVVADNRGEVRRNIGSINVSMSNMKTIYAGGIVGINSSHTPSYQNADEGGLTENNIVLSANIISKQETTTKLHYGDIVGYNALSATPSIGGVNNNYIIDYSTTVTEDFDPSEKDNEYILEELILGNTLVELDQNALDTIFGVTNSPLWDLTNGIHIVALENLRGVE